MAAKESTNTGLRSYLLGYQGLVARALRVGLSDAQDRVRGVTAGAGVAVLASLGEDRIDLAPEGRQAQEPGTT